MVLPALQSAWQPIFLPIISSRSATALLTWLIVQRRQQRSYHALFVARISLPGELSRDAREFAILTRMGAGALWFAHVHISKNPSVGASVSLLPNCPIRSIRLN